MRNLKQILLNSTRRNLNIRMLLSFSWLLVILAPFSLAHAAEPVKIGVLSYRSKPQTLVQWQPLAVILKKSIPERDFMVEAYTYTELDQAVASRQLDFVLTNPGHYIALSQRSGLSSPLVTVVGDEKGKALSMFGGVVFCRVDAAGLASLGNLKGKMIAVVSTDSLGGYQAQTYELKKAGIRLPQDVKIIITGMPHDHVVEAVLAGRAEVGFVRSGVLEAMASEGKLDMAQIRVINRQNLPGFPVQVSTRLYPEWPLAAMPNIDEDMARRVAAALLVLRANSSVLKSMNIHGFVIPADYTPVGNLLRELRLPPFEAAPEFTLHDIWNRLGWEITIILAAIAAIVLMAFRLILTNRRLGEERRVVLQQKRQLQEGEEHFRSLIVHASIPMAVNSKTGAIKALNNKFIETFGYTLEDLPNLEAWWPLAYPDEAYRAWIAAEWQGAADKAVRDGTSVVPIEARISCKDGSVRIAMVSGSFIGDHFMVTFNDITERQQREAALQETEYRFRSTFNAAAIGMALVSLNGRFVQVNDALCSLVGYAQADLLQKTFQEITHPDDLEADLELLRELQAGIRDSFHMEKRYFHQDGHLVWILLSASSVRDSVGNVLYYIAQIQDITQSKQAESVLRASENKFSKVFHTSPLGIGISRISDSKFIDVNEAFLQIYGYTREEIIGHTCNELMLWTDLDHRAKVIAATIRQGSLRNMELEFRRKSGETGTQLVSLDTIEIAGELCILGLITDITERKQSEQLLKENEQRLLYLLNTSPIAVRIASATSGQVIFSNLRFAEMHHTTPEKLVGRDIRQHYADPREYDDILQRLATGGPALNKLILLHLPGDKKTWVYASYMPMEYQGEPVVLGWFYDVTELRHASEELQLASLVYQNSSEAMMVTDPDGTILTINPAFTELTGYSEQEVLGQNTRILNSGHHDQAFYQAMRHDLNTIGHWQGEVWDRRKNGEIFVEWLSINAIFDADNAIQRCVALFSDISERKAEEERMHHLARYDALTDLPNRTLLSDRLSQSLAQARRGKSHLAVMFLDLDEFKPVNDLHGHEIGDLLLKEVAQRLLECCVRETDTVSRLGGDEFVVLLPGIAQEQDASIVAEKILAALNLPFKIAGYSLRISCSIGIAVFPRHGDSEKQLLSNADTAMYYAKKNGRNTMEFYQSEMQKILSNAL